MDKEDVINYVMTTPGNSNRAVLDGMLDSMANTGGGSNVHVIHLTTSDAYPNQLTLTPDKTYEETVEAYNEGKAVIAIIEPYTGRNENWTNAMVLSYESQMKALRGTDFQFGIPNTICVSFIWGPYVNNGSPRIQFCNIATSFIS